MTFTHDELIAAIQGSRKDAQDDPRTITTSELAEARGIPVDRARRQIRDAVKAGTLRPESVYRTNIAGERQRTKGYRLVQVGGE